MLPPPRPVVFPHALEVRIGRKAFRPVEEGWLRRRGTRGFILVRLVVKAGEVLHQYPHAGRIDGQHVRVHMQPATAMRQQAERNRRGRRSAKIRRAMAPRVALDLEPARKRLRIKRRHVLHIEMQRATIRIDGLTPFRIDPEAQHRVSPAKPADRNGQFFQLQSSPLELEIKMGRNFSEHPIRLPTDPVGHLHRS